MQCENYAFMLMCACVTIIAKMPTVRYLHGRRLFCTCIRIHTRLLRNGAAAEKRTERLLARILVAKSAEPAPTTTAEFAIYLTNTENVLLALGKAHFGVIIAREVGLHQSHNGLHFGNPETIHLAEELVDKRALYSNACCHQAV